MSVIVDGVVLAAGRSSRMEQPKPLLAVGSDTFLQRAVQILRAANCHRIYVVVNAGAEWSSGLAADPDVEVVVNQQPDSEQVDSLRLVLERLPESTRGILILPVDLPLVSPESARAVTDAFMQDPGPLYLPFHNTVAGHPVLLGRELFHEVLSSTLKEGMRSLIMKHSSDLREVRVVDPGILIDIDTPDDYWRYIEKK
jgi:molybdenum cofactor cytidylyltransferase